MNTFMQYSPTVLYDNFTVDKTCYEFNTYSESLSQNFNITICVAFFMYLKKQTNDYRCGLFSSKQEYLDFLQRIDLGSDKIAPLTDYEMNFFELTKQNLQNEHVRGKYYDKAIDKTLSSVKLPYNGYIYPVVKDESGNILPEYYFPLALYSPWKIQGNRLWAETDIMPDSSVLKELSYKIEVFENEKFFSFCTISKQLINNLWFMFSDYILKNKLDIERFNVNYANLIGIKDYGIRLSYKNLVYSFARNLEANKKARLCKNCAKLFEYKENKIYCSERCKIAASNSRRYKKRKSKVTE